MRPRNLRLLATLALLAPAAALTGSVLARETARSTEYLCPSGERFVVERYDTHVRLRTGSGVFALTTLAGEHGERGERGERHSDGVITLWHADGQARLERPDLTSSGACRRISEAS